MSRYPPCPSRDSTTADFVQTLLKAQGRKEGRKEERKKAEGRKEDRKEAEEGRDEGEKQNEGKVEVVIKWSLESRMH